MELFKSLENKTKLFVDPFKHFEINEPLTKEAINEISKADIADPKKQNLNYDGTRALDGGEGTFRAGIKDGGKAKKIRCYVTKDNSSQFPHLSKFIDELRAEKLLQEKLKANKKIEIIWDSVVEDVLGTTEPKGVNGIKIKNVKDNKTKELKVDGLFIAIGHDPATQLFKDQLDMDKEGYLITKPDSTITNIPGVFAAGDVKDKIFRQAVTAAGMGCMAALEAEKHLSHN